MGQGFYTLILMRQAIHTPAFYSGARCLPSVQLGSAKSILCHTHNCPLFKGGGGQHSGGGGVLVFS